MEVCAIDRLKNTEKVLTISEVLKYFNDKCHQTLSFPPIKPKAGEIYLFVRDDTNKGMCKFQIIISAGNYDVYTLFKHNNAYQKY